MRANQYAGASKKHAYNFELLHCLLAHVHPSGLLHLHQAQVLARQKENTELQHTGNALVPTRLLLTGHGFLCSASSASVSSSFIDLWLVSQHAFLPPPL